MNKGGRRIPNSTTKVSTMIDVVLFRGINLCLFPPVRIFVNLFLRAGYFFNAFD